MWTWQSLCILGSVVLGGHVYRQCCTLRVESNAGVDMTDSSPKLGWVIWVIGVERLA